MDSGPGSVGWILGESWMDSRWDSAWIAGQEMLDGFWRILSEYRMDSGWIRIGFFVDSGSGYDGQILDGF